jgi:two-component system, NtrC family, response regulator
MGKLKIVLIDDEDILRITLADDLKDKGHSVTDFVSPVAALKYINNKEPDIVITDMKMPEMNGIMVLEQTKKISSAIEVIVMTAFGTIDSAVEAMKLGAYDYITKPFDLENLLFILDKIVSKKELEESNRQFRSFFEEKYNLNSLIGNADSINEIKRIVEMVAQKDSTILITGETGTGKELLANIIHYQSMRHTKPLIKVSCAVLSKDVFESELFGHEKGSFTGAIDARKGRFEMADGGTIYLDDIDDIPMALQVKLLRVLQEREFERVGGNETIPVNVRVLASTKTDLKELVTQGKFREDLYYRLNVFPINLPPLRNRKSDMEMLLNHFLFVANDNKNLVVEENARQFLLDYNWPGNVRELKNIAERMVILACGNSIDIDCLPKEVCSSSTQSNKLPDTDHIGEKSLNNILEDIEIKLIKRALDQCRGNQAKAAELLMIPSSTLRTKVIKYQIQF